MGATTSPVKPPGQRLHFQAGLEAQVPGLVRPTFGHLYRQNMHRFSYLCPSTETLTSDFTGRELCDDITVAISSFSSCRRGLGPHKRRHYFFFLN